MIDNTKEYILCAAIKRVTPREGIHPYHEGTNDMCNIEIGYRHHDIFQRFKTEVSNKMEDQGFYTSKGRFVDRYEGMEIAYKAGQVSEDIALKKDWHQKRTESFPGTNFDEIDKKKYNMLFSEHIY